MFSCEGSGADLPMNAEKVMSQLTTHVLDTALGKPAGELSVSLMRVDENESITKLKQTKTNSNGRTDEPLLSSDDFQPGTYLLTFAVSEYFHRTEQNVASPPFFDQITLRFTIAANSGSYHVPLLVSPWSYSTYRGS